MRGFFQLIYGITGIVVCVLAAVRLGTTIFELYKYGDVTVGRDKKKTHPRDDDKFERKRRRLAAKVEREDEEISRAKLRDLEIRAANGEDLEDEE